MGNVVVIITTLSAIIVIICIKFHGFKAVQPLEKALHSIAMPKLFSILFLFRENGGSHTQIMGDTIYNNIISEER